MKTTLSLLALVLLQATLSAAEPALVELNAQRAARGLPPYLEDPDLTEAAQRAADYRAAHLMFGHVPGPRGDFQFLSAGVSADAAGCAAYPVSYGFLACACYERWRYAGAATALGADGKRYCHLFVRNSAPRKK